MIRALTLAVALASVACDATVVSPAPASSATAVATASAQLRTSALPVPTRTNAATASVSTSAATLSAAAVCAGRDPKQHVYNPSRLVLLEPCKTAIGVVRTERREADGDWHLGVRLDPGQDALINEQNKSGQDGDLVIEIICALPITQADAVSACANYANTIPLPPLGAHISVTGPFVLDTAHGWLEIHPVWAITLVSGSPWPSASASRSTSPTASSTPRTSSAPLSSPPPFATMTPPASLAPAPSLAPVPATPAAVPITAAQLSVTITTSRYGLIVASATPGASCSAVVILPSGRTSTAAGLQVTYTVEPTGSVAWSYGTTSSTTAGTGTHTVSCTYLAQTQQASAPFMVGETSAPVPTAAPTAAPTVLTVTITSSRYGLVGATTVAGATCSASARLPSGRISTAAGLQVTQTADASGSAFWSYNTTSNTTPGMGTHTVTCTYQGQVQSASAPFSVP